MKKLIAVAVTALGLTLALSACSPNGSTTTAPEPAPSHTTASQTPTPTPTYITPVDREEVAVTATRDGLATSIDWDELLGAIDRQETPVITGLVATPGATFTIVGSSDVIAFSSAESMEITRNADGDAVFSPRIGANGAVKGAGGFVSVDLDGVHSPVLIRVIAITEEASE